MAGEPDSPDRLDGAASTARDLLTHALVDRWEVFTKASRSRRIETAPGAPPQVIQVKETGVAVRSVRAGTSGFGAASGRWIDAARRAVEGALGCAAPVPFDPLPPPHLLGRADCPPARERPPDGWAVHTTEQLAAAVTRLSDGALALRRSMLQEGSFTWLLTTSDGFVAGHRSSATSLLTEVQPIRHRSGVWREWTHIPEPEGFDATAYAERIADRVLLSCHPITTDSGLRDLILAPEVAAELIAAVSPLFLATPPERDLLPQLVDPRGELAASALTLIDDRTDPEAPITGPCDGEGLPAQRILVLDAGIPRHRLASYRDAVAYSEVPRGGSVRLSYRDYPATGFANLKVAPTDGVAPSQMLEIADRALYLLRPLAPIVIDAASDGYRIVASGAWLRGAKVRGWHPVVELRGSLSRLLRRIDAVGTDPSWFQTDRGCVAAPSLLVRSQPVVG